ncbi:hypothetical protein J3458_017263 [Metarhizium acridum]|uniref:uncharacterized protein n=1 Tax=Metarhizium acridum TaxID=92637 RepID=UPI001C6C756B|nr:hypothetical protein J3458_017263 [Metarhizium acridum]
MKDGYEVMRNSHFWIINEWAKAKTQQCASEWEGLNVLIVNMKRDGRLSSGPRHQCVNVTGRHASPDEWFDRRMTAALLLLACHRQRTDAFCRSGAHGKHASSMALIAAEIKVTVGCSESLTGERGKGQKRTS